MRARSLEIAEQLGSYELVKEHDEKRIAPGREIIEKMLGENKPVLLLIDELTEYIVKRARYRGRDEEEGRENCR
ncbi:MAG: DUF499 domain-containing protein [Thermoproteota archaeon]